MDEKEPGVLGQWGGIYEGALRGAAVGATVLTVAFFLFAVYCGWRFLGAADALQAARWGVGTILLMMAVGFLKTWFWMRMESSNILRAVKRLEMK